MSTHISQLPSQRRPVNSNSLKKIKIKCNKKRRTSPAPFWCGVRIPKRNARRDHSCSSRVGDNCGKRCEAGNDPHTPCGEAFCKDPPPAAPEKQGSGHDTAACKRLLYPPEQQPCPCLRVGPSDCAWGPPTAPGALRLRLGPSYCAWGPQTARGALRLRVGPSDCAWGPQTARGALRLRLGPSVCAWGPTDRAWGPQTARGALRLRVGPSDCAWGPQTVYGANPKPPQFNH